MYSVMESLVVVLVMQGPLASGLDVAVVISGIFFDLSAFTCPVWFHNLGLICAGFRPSCPDRLFKRQGTFLPRMQLLFGLALSAVSLLLFTNEDVRCESGVWSNGRAGKFICSKLNLTRSGQKTRCCCGMIYDIPLHGRLIPSNRVTEDRGRCRKVFMSIALYFGDGIAILKVYSPHKTDNRVSWSWNVAVTSISLIHLRLNVGTQATC